MSSPSKRRDNDILKLMMAGHEVLMGDDASDFYVKLRGPADSLYSGGFYRIHVTLPTTYPYKSPSIGFTTPIFHPNVDESSGSVCLDVINQTWSPMYDLVNVFAVFLPQLLLYPNPADPLNRAAAQLLNKDSQAYEAKVREHVRVNASVDFRMSDDSDSDDDSDDSDNNDSDDSPVNTRHRSATDASTDDFDDSQLDDVEMDEEIFSDCDDWPSDSILLHDNPADALAL